MPVNREATIGKAEKLARQGKLAEAIAEYASLVADSPRDWNTINTLGDLYLRAGDADRAVEQFAVVADHLYGEGFLPRAAALYKKALKAKPDHDHALSRLADIAVAQGLTVDARAYLHELMRQRAQRGDVPGVEECGARLEALIEGSREKLQIEDWAAPAIVAPLEPEPAVAVTTTEEQPTPSSSIDLALVDLDLAIESGDEDQIRRAQAELCDVYLEASQGVEARILATDLVAQEPDSLAHRERLKWAHQLLGTTPPDSIVDSAADITAFDVDAPASSVASVAAADVPADPLAIETIFEKLRDDVAREHRELAAEQYERGVKKMEQGKLAEAIQDLEAATRTPVRRFVASASLGRKLIADGELRVAVEWLEQAAGALPPNDNERRSLLYDLADTLERLGENERALTVLRTLEKDASGYADVRARIARLSPSQPRSSKA